MARMAVSQLRENLQSVIELAQSEAVIIEKHGSPTAVLISYERYDELMNALEDQEDLEYLEQNPPDLTDTIPWEDVKRELGI
jgi:prevent-host-death family protein